MNNSGPRNIAMVPSAFHPSLGGVEELVRQLALEQRRRGWNTSVAVNRWPRNLPAQETIDGIPVRRYSFRVGGAGGLRRRLAARVLFLPTVGALRHDLAAQSVNLLHIQCISCGASYCLAAARALRIPLVVSLQGELTMDANGSFQKQAAARAMYRRVLAEADFITACSKQTLHEAQDFFGADLAHKSRVVYNGVRLEEFTTAQPHIRAKPYILAIGRHVRQKGIDVLMRAFARANIDSHDLVVAGEGPETGNLQALAGELGISSKVFFVGRASHDQAVSLFAGCSFFVLPSRHEPMGIVNLEAMAAGKAVLATAVGGVPELVIDQETGLLVPGENIEAMSAALTTLAQNTSLRQQMGAAGLQRVKLFSWQSLADQYEDVYRRVLEGRQGDS